VPGWSGGSRVGLVGVDDVKVPYWAQVDQEVVAAGTRTVAGALPGLLGRILRRVWRIAPRLTLLAGVVQLASGVLSAFGLLATASVLTELLAQGPTPARVLAALPAIGLVVASYAGRGLLETATGAVEGRLAPLILRDAQDELYTLLARVELVAFDDADFVELMHKAEMGLSRLRSTATSVGDLLAGLVAVVAAVTAAGLLHPALIAVVALPALGQAWATTKVARLHYEWFLAMTSRSRRLGVVTSLLTSRIDAAEVRAFTTSGLLIAEQRHLNASLTHDAITVEDRATRIRLAGRTLSGIGTGLAYTLLGTLIYLGALALALAGAAALAMRTAASSVSTSIHTINRLYEDHLHLQLYERALTDSRTRTRTPPPTPTPTPAPTTATDVCPPGSDSRGTGWAELRSPEHRVGRIELRGVTFTYPGQDEPAVHEVDLTLRAGQVIALVGENGSGKSTLARLISGLYLPDSGTVSWDGRDITTINPEHLLRRVAIVAQHPAQWPMSAANNIRIGRITRPDPDAAHLTDTARRTGADTVADELPEGWETMLSRRFQSGRDLSGGQWQRISVARALYRDAPLVIADEPTAALDARAEHTVFTTLRTLAAAPPDHHDNDQPTDSTRGRTVDAPSARDGRITVLITHRLANVRDADQIIVLNHGRVADIGTHHELLGRPGDYRELFHLQARSYQLDPTP
jgi:ATP-binding cassette subfamily B protein